MRLRACGGCRARELVRMKKPLPRRVRVNSEDRVAMSQTVRTKMSWQVCVPVGSSSRATRMGTLEADELGRVSIFWRRSLDGCSDGGREERVAWMLTGRGVVEAIVVKKKKTRRRDWGARFT